MSSESFHKKTIRDIDLDQKTILLRADYNVPLTDDGKIADDYRIKKSLPTVQFLLEHKCKIIICSHLGRPDGKPNKKLSLRPCAKRLGELLDRPVKFLGDCIGEDVTQKIKELQPGDIAMLENVRFYPGEEANDETFAKTLASYADIFVQDAFGVVHHPAVSVSEIPKYIPGVAGLLVENEVETITKVIEKPDRPLMAIVGGAKISDKIEILKRFIEIADFLVVGGAMANTFLLAEGIKIGKSLAEPEDVPLARDIMDEAKKQAKKRPFVFYLPQDGVVAKAKDKNAHTRIVDWDTQMVAEVENYPKKAPREAREVAPNEVIYDIGPFSGAFIAGGIQLANTVVWNGTMGVTETPSVNGPIGPFAHGTELIIEAMLGKNGHRPFSLVGGGDTASYIEQREMTDLFDFVSTGGGASLELMAGRKLPGVEALLDKDAPVRELQPA